MTRSVFLEALRQVRWPVAYTADEPTLVRILAGLTLRLDVFELVFLHRFPDHLSDRTFEPLKFFEAACIVID
jgi:hypothetical protein